MKELQCFQPPSRSRSLSASRSFPQTSISVCPAWFQTTNVSDSSHTNYFIVSFPLLLSGMPLQQLAKLEHQVIFICCRHVWYQCLRLPSTHWHVSPSSLLSKAEMYVLWALCHSQDRECFQWPRLKIIKDKRQLQNPRRHHLRHNRGHLHWRWVVPETRIRQCRSMIT